jgi:hypothetical protein
MKKTKALLGFILSAAVTLAACGGGGGGGGTTDGGGGGGGGGGDTTLQPWHGTLITSPTVSPIVSFRQSIVSQDTGTVNEIFPGQANAWMLDGDFSLVDGFDDQFFFGPALTVGAEAFPIDQDYSELTFYTPLMGAAEGVKVAVVSDGTTVFPSLDALVFPSNISSVKDGSTYAAFLNATSDSRLQRTIDLTTVPQGTVIPIAWRQAVSPDAGNIPGYNPTYRACVRSTDGNLLKTLQAPTVTGPQSRADTLNEFAGQTIVLSFELQSSNSSFNQAYAIIDSVSVTIGLGTPNILTNGDFETGDLTGWTTNTPAEVQNVTSGARTLNGLAVKRSFYTVPNKLWGRWVDMFENPTAAPITTTVIYDTNLGSAGAGIIYYSPGTTNRAVTSWDSGASGDNDRDIGWVFGTARSSNFISDDGSGLVGDPLITVTHDITVPAGGSVAIVNFIIMSGTDTGLTAAGNPAVRATDIDNTAAAIVANFWTDTQYRTGMTPQQEAVIKNFAR